jgi:hypothetical protein
VVKEKRKPRGFSPKLSMQWDTLKYGFTSSGLPKTGNLFSKKRSDSIFLTTSVKMPEIKGFIWILSMDIPTMFIA